MPVLELEFPYSQASWTPSLRAFLPPHQTALLIYENLQFQLWLYCQHSFKNRKYSLLALNASLSFAPKVDQVQDPTPILNLK